MLTVPQDLRQQLRQSGQEHVLAWWDELDDLQRRGLLEQLQDLDVAQLQGLYEGRDQAGSVPAAERIEPVPVIRLGQDEDRARQAGEASLRRGEVAVLLVAGGQGSRLGFE